MGMILTNGKIITVDKDFTVHQAVWVENDKVAAAGRDTDIIKLAGKGTRVIDLKGSTVIPGIIDAHLHPESASVSELENEIPDLHTEAELLEWLEARVASGRKHEWIIHPKLFFTRLKELRMPPLTMLDKIAPDNPVFFNGSFGGMINTAAVNASGIAFNPGHPGVIMDKKTGKFTGFIRASAFPLLKLPQERELNAREKLDALNDMLKRYNRSGITSVCSGEGDYSNYEAYKELHRQHRLTVRVFQNFLLKKSPGKTVEMLCDEMRNLDFVTGYGDEWVRVGSIKIMLDGGILTGTAYMDEPWGEKAADIFGTGDKGYRGVLSYNRDELLSMVSLANDLNWKFAAHCTGKGAVDMLLDVFEEVNNKKPIREGRFAIIHGNFFDKEAIRKMSSLGVYADMQPAWFYKDTEALRLILGEERTRCFHPYRSMIDAGVKINGGSDHMVKWDPDRSVNPYNPFLGMSAMVTRATSTGSVIMEEEATGREEALRIYTINNAFASFEENIKGSIEAGKLADIVVLSDDILTCRQDHIRNIKSELTIVGGKIVYSSGKFPVTADI
jgi:predicted amidohydrolase YtcJ